MHINDKKLQAMNGKNIRNNYKVIDDNINKNKLQVKIQQNEMNINNNNYKKDNSIYFFYRHNSINKK